MSVKRVFVTVTLLLTALLATAAHAKDWRKSAEGREVDCLLQVNGKTYLDGTCMYDADKDGSFRLFGDKYFVYLNVFEKGVAGASWNANPKSSHAQAPLGEDFTQEGGCWVGKNAKICAWNKTEGKPKQSQSTLKRIKFARGAYSAIVTGKLTGFSSEQNYVISVGKGQTMMVKQIDRKGGKYVSVYLTDPNGDDANDLDASCHSEAKVSPSMAGDYVIKVVECQKADPWKGSYSLKVTVK